MRRLSWIAIGVLLLSGCATRERAAVLGNTPGPHGPPRCANLALGPTAEHGHIAELFTRRSTWPSVETGYRFGETSYYTEVNYDDQAFYDRFGGGFHRGSESYRSGVLLR